MLRKAISAFDDVRSTKESEEKTCASYLHDSGVPLKTISMLLGHSDVSTTARYYLRNTLDDKHLVEMVNGAFDNFVDLK